MPRQPNQINSDIYPGDNVDVVFDACQPWPLEDNSIGHVRSHHVLEHLCEPKMFFKEAYRVLAPSDDECNVTLRLPYGASNDAIGDITHLRQWVPTSFACFQPGYGASVYNKQHNSWDAPFAVITIYQRINPQLRWLLKPIIRNFGVKIIEFLWGGYQEMIIGMKALKKPDEVARWQVRNRSATVPVARVMYHHEYEGREIGENEKPRFLFFGPGGRELQKQADKGSVYE